jgi:hypothetical protein
MYEEAIGQAIIGLRVPEVVRIVELGTDEGP